jgi:hypothetical protein
MFSAEFDATVVRFEHATFPFEILGRQSKLIPDKVRFYGGEAHNSEYRHFRY